MKYRSLLVHVAARSNYATERGRELAINGLMRRIKVMTRCLENVFRLLPPHSIAIPAEMDLADATISVHAFILNVYGAVDNIAGVFAKERGVLDAKGRPLGAHQIGFTKKHTLLRDACSGDLKDYLDSLDGWFTYLENFRHALAHRIPPYFPPHQVSKSNLDAYRAIEAQQDQIDEDVPEYERLEREKLKFARFVPEILHSYSERSPSMIIHAQMIADLNTVEELFYKVESELRQ